MAFETGTATTVADLFSKLNTFASGIGWTINHSASDRLFLTKGTCSVAFRWASASPPGAGIYHHTAFLNSGTDPGNHTNDSGQGIVTGVAATLLTGRSVPMINTPFLYWFFAGTDHINIVVEVGSLQVRHFGFGQLTKFGTWTGGSYAFGWRHPGVATATDHQATYMLDGLSGFTTPASVRPFVASVHMEGMPGQAVGSRWGLTWAGGNANVTTDRGGTARVNLQGGYRGGTVPHGMGRFGGSPASGLVPLTPIVIYYDDPTTVNWYEIGMMTDARSVNMRNFVSGQEVVIGADTWVFFPAKHKTDTAANGTLGAGVAFKKVMTAQGKLKS